MQVNTTMSEKSLKDSSKRQKIKIESKPLKTGGLLHAWAIFFILFLCKKNSFNVIRTKDLYFRTVCIAS